MPCVAGQDSGCLSYPFENPLPIVLAAIKILALIIYQAEFTSMLNGSEMTQETKIYKAKNAIRIVSAAALFDGHDAAINVMRRILQASGAELIHLGHNRSVEEVVTAAIQEDAQAIALSSYQGGHMEFFKYCYDMLRERDAGHIKIFGGGGGVIVPKEIAELHAYGINRIFSPDDGRQLGLQGMINIILEESDFSTIPASLNGDLNKLDVEHHSFIARMISLAENSQNGTVDSYNKVKDDIAKQAASKTIPVIGMTGTGGAGKSSLCDELVRRFTLSNENKTIAILSVDPSKKKTGGALLGDRIRMNSINSSRIYMRSMATRGSHSELGFHTDKAVEVLKAAGFDLIIIETAGIGQGDSAITEIADLSIYVMTSEFGAASQLEKIDMLDFADIAVINKFERKGSKDALRDVQKIFKRNRQLGFDIPLDAMPVFGTIASRFNDDGVNSLYAYITGQIKEKCAVEFKSLFADDSRIPTGKASAIPANRQSYLAMISDTVHNYKNWAEAQIKAARQLGHLEAARNLLHAAGKDLGDLDSEISKIDLDDICSKLLAGWPKCKEAYTGDVFCYQVRDKKIEVALNSETLAGSKIPKVALPKYEDKGELLRFLLLENLAGQFPYTAGLFPFKRQMEDPKRMFAGEGPPEKTNKRFHLLCKGEKAHRLSTAFDSVTLYGEDPAERPDIFGKIGESGVSICTLDDIKKLYAGFDLCAPTTSVSMTINGPAPIILAMFMNAAIDGQVEKFVDKEGRQPDASEYAAIKQQTLNIVRGTVQADIFKEDQAQNTCIFSTEFALKMMGDIQEYFIANEVRNYYSVSISGYHIAEAGANPISQLAFTMANGFTLVEYYLSRGMDINDFAPNLSFFFSNGLDAEYSVIGRVARRIWSITMRDLYGGNKRSQMLKYHIQTSGRSLHAQEIQFNDIRTTLQALIALYDNCNSLHTNAYDEAITTPTDESVRRAMAIQLIIGKEFGVAKNENSLQGSFLFDELTDLVEEAVLAEFCRISERGGVLGAMETQYQRSKIQEESLYYEHLKHSGKLPIIGVNCYENPETLEENYQAPEIELRRSSYEEKQRQLDNLRAFHDTHKGRVSKSLNKLQQVAIDGANIFEEMMETVKAASLGQISQALYEVGGQYRRNM